jgi:hypothetical protein
MWSTIAHEDILTPEAALPIQFHAIWSQSRAITPERALALAVLEQARLDLQKYRYARRRRQQRLYRDAYEWVAADDISWPFSFVNICGGLSLSPEALRAQLLDHTGAQPSSTDTAERMGQLDRAA